MEALGRGEGEARGILDRFFSVRTGACLADVKPGQVAVATCDRRTYAELGFGFVRLLWALHLGDRAVVSVHPSALPEVARLVWAATPDEVLEEEFAQQAVWALQHSLPGLEVGPGDLGVKLYHPGGARPTGTEGEIRPVTPADRSAWPGPRAFMHASDHPSAARGEAFGLFLGEVLVGDVMTHDASVAEMAHLVAEEGIEVAEGYRRRGFAKALLCRWTYEMQRRGRVCLHGTSLANGASIALAQSAGYLPYARHRSINWAGPSP